MQKPLKKPQQTSLTNFIKSKYTTKDQDINSDLSKNSEIVSKQEQKKFQQKEPIPMYNVEFYRNQRTSQPNGDYIEKIHKLWCDNFNLLQRHHGFIQWLFPNSFTSRFNSLAYALTKDEQKIFRTDITIAKRYVTSYQMMLRFYGMKLKSKQSGEIVRVRDINFKQRYIATLLTSFHNHMRITRILCSLTMIGFGRYAKQLSIFLNEQIHGQKGQLRPLAKYNVDKDWKQYRNYVESYEDLNVYLRVYVDEKKMIEQRAKLEKNLEKNQESKQAEKRKEKSEPKQKKREGSE